jgi:hypothetical protein
MRLFALLLITFTSSCSINNRIIAEGAPSLTLIPRSQLEIRNEKVYQKGSTELFSGVTVEYLAGFDYVKYINGTEVLEEVDVSQYEKDLFPHEVSHQQAVRDSVDQVGPGHSTYFFYAEHGKESDLPLLLYGLKQMGESHGEFVCTRSHCLDALQKITGVKPGINHSDWQKWWRSKYGTDIPLWNPKKLNHNKEGLGSRHAPPHQP